MQKLLLIFIIMATWMVVSCRTTSTGNGRCWGFWNEAGIGGNNMKRGTLLSNRSNKHPYWQCVDENPPHHDREKRPYG